MTQVINEKSQLKSKLDQILLGKNIQKYLGTDPIRFPKKYKDHPALQEVIALIAALLAYGRVKAIGIAIEDVLSRFGEDKMIDLLTSESVFQCEQRCQGFVYRFTTAQDLLKLMVGIRHILLQYGRLGLAVEAWLKSQNEQMNDLNDLIPLIAQIRHWILEGSIDLPKGKGLDHLLSDPSKNSCCKRWHMFMRWMVRQDEVDLGLWSFLGTHRLIMPVDTHVHRLGLALGLSQRKIADLKCAREMTQTLAQFDPIDPVKYDFAIAHLGISDQISDI
jgi:uncharacterized protein (TIGR02757 family)